MGFNLEPRNKSMLKIAVFCLVIFQTLAVHPALGKRRRSEGLRRRQILNDIRRRMGGLPDQDAGLAGDRVKDDIVFNIALDDEKQNDDASEWVISTEVENYIWIPFTKSKDGSLKFGEVGSTRLFVSEPEQEMEDWIVLAMNSICFWMMGAHLFFRRHNLLHESNIKQQKMGKTGMELVFKSFCDLEPCLYIIIH